MWHERDLLRFGEKVVRPAIKNHATDNPQWHEFLGDDLGRVEHIERQRLCSFKVEGLYREVPLGVIALVDRFPQVTAVEVRIGTRNLHGFIPRRRLDHHSA